MVSGHTGNVVLRKELRVRAPCPPLVTSLLSTAFVDSSVKLRRTRLRTELPRGGATLKTGKVRVERIAGHAPIQSNIRTY